MHPYRAENVRVELHIEEDGAVTITLDRHTDCILMPWPSAYELYEMLRDVIAEVQDENDPIDVAELLREQEQIKLNVHQGMVALVFGWGDRFRYHWRSLKVLMQALGIKIQDVQYAERQVLMPTLKRDHAKRIRKLNR